MENRNFDSVVNHYCYAVNPHNGFSIVKLSRGDTFVTKETSLNRLVYVREGELTIQIINSEKFVVPEHHFTFIPLGTPFEFTTESEVDFLMLSTVMVEMICHRVTMPHPKLDKLEFLTYSPQTHAYRAPKVVRDLFATVCEYLEARMGCTELYHLKECELFLVLRFVLKSDDFRMLFHPMFEKRIDFKAKVISLADKTTSVNRLAEQLGMERTSFHRLFKQEFDMPPAVWMQRHKAERTLKYIRRRDMPLKLVAAELEFSSQTHLNEFCKRQWGKTAKQLREEV